MAEQSMPPAQAPARTQEWRASQLLRRPVVHALRMEHLGEVADIVFDPDGGELAGLLVGPPGPEGNVLDVMRRAVGRDLGLAFVPADQILALDADIVMVQAGRTRGLGLSGSPRVTRWPQLRLVRGFAVVTMWGQRLGRLVDLVLDPSGRRVTGYLINPSADAPRPTQPGARPFLTAKRAAKKSPTDTGAPESQQQSEPDPSSLLVVPTSAHVRVGRDLIVVGEPSVARPGGPGHGVRVVDAGAPEWPAVPDLPSAGSDGAAGQDWGHHTDMRYPPDAPTEAL